MEKTIKPEIIKLNIDSCKNNNGILEIYTLNQSDTIILIIPGGSYAFTSIRESNPVSDRFLSLGYNTSILRYSVFPLTHPTQLNEGVKSLEILSKRFKNIFCIGFSAGGHLTGLLGTNDIKYNLKGIILCYPVISFNEYCHEKSRQNFLGELDNENNRKLFSIQNRVNKNTVPCFVWTMKTDELVNYNNSVLLIEALKKNNIKFQYEIFENGVHGIALADKTTIKNDDKNYINENVAKWVDKAVNFIEDILKNK